MRSEAKTKQGACKTGILFMPAMLILQVFWPGHRLELTGTTGALAHGNQDTDPCTCDLPKSC